MSRPHYPFFKMQRVPSWAPSWWRLLLSGLALWIASVIVTAVTGNVNMVPTVVLLGSFLVPVTAIVWYLDHYDSANVGPTIVFRAFVVGGVIGVLAASLLESLLLSDGVLVYVGVGLIEEAAKLLALVYIARRLVAVSVRDGVVLGSAVGFGFAALESSGYAFSAMIHTTTGGVVLSLPALVFTELLRGILAPFGHGLWTGILGGVLFASARDGKPRLSWRLFWAYLGVSLLHAIWDSMRGIAALVTAVLVYAQQLTLPFGAGPVLRPRSGSIGTFVGVEFVGLAVISLIAILWLVRLWRRASGVEPQPSTSPHLA